MLLAPKSCLYPVMDTARNLPEMIEINAGDHLRVPRQHGLFAHHGIYLGDGSVAHYLEGREILRSSISEFSYGQPLSTLVHAQCSPIRVTLQRAVNRIGEQNYNLLFNNCEHFATWCKTGRHRSLQVEGWLHTSSLGALAIGQLMPAALLTGVRVLLQQGLVNKSSYDHVCSGLVQLAQLRETLLKRLEDTLNQVESRIHGVPDDRYRQLLLIGQTLADELSDVEDLQTRLSAMLNKR